MLLHFRRPFGCTARGGGREYPTAPLGQRTRRLLQGSVTLPDTAAAAVAAAPSSQPWPLRALPTHQGQVVAGAPPSPAGRPTSSIGSGSRSLRPLLRAAGQVTLLAVALAGLILLPAQLSGRFAAEPACAAASYCLYLLFFASGTIVRVLRHGQLAPRQRDAQLGNRASRLAFALFLAAVPAGHHVAWWDPSLHLLVTRGGSLAKPLLLLLPAAGYALMLAAWALNAAAAGALGKAWDRLVPPDNLVTSGPYRLVQHPIYTSYMLLFCGYCLSLRSPAAAALLWAACLTYYAVRTRIEEGLLEKKFGVAYSTYRDKTGRFVPRWQ